MNMPPNHSSQQHQAPQGVVLEVAHIPSKYGAEIHTRIVLKGHPLPALWRNAQLHHSTQPELFHKPENCIYCQQCSQLCPKGCLHQGDAGLEISYEVCDACGICVRECPSMALEIAGQRTTAGDLLHKTLKQNYTTARKITRVDITGGEPGLQTAFCADLLFQLAAAAIPTTLQTSGLADFEDLLPLLGRPRQIIFELVTTDNRLHNHLTGYGNERILENLKNISLEIGPTTELVVRTPLILYQTANQIEIYRTGRWLVETLLPNCHGWELFEPLSACEEVTPFSESEWTQFSRWAAGSGFPPAQIKLVDRDSQQR